jgi:hypothetical protein
MHHQRGRHSLFLALALATAACRDSAGPATTLAIPAPPDFAAVVTSSTHYEFFAPSGHWISQYDVWVAIPPSDSANAGVVVAAARPVFSSTNGVLERVSPADITLGDSIQVWHDSTLAYGSTQAPPGAPAYHGLQIVIVRSGR